MFKRYRVHKFFKVMSIIAFLAISSFSQGKAGNENVEDIYFEALKIYLEKNELEYSKIIPTKDYQNVTVGKNSFITKNLPSRIGVYSINFVSLDELKKKILKTKIKNDKLKVPVVEIYPVKIVGNQLVVNFSESYASYQNKKLTLSVSDGARVFFSFDCSKQEYVFDRIEFWGI